MADGLVLNAGSGGATLKTDDTGAGGHVQVNKLAVSADGDGTLIPATAADGLLVKLAAQGGTDLMDVTVNNTAGAPVPVQLSDGSAAQTFATADLDSGAGTVTRILAGIALPASGGPVAGGTATNPLRTDPTGTTTQPVSGTVTANLGTIGGAATETTLATRLSESDFDAKIGSLTETAPASDTASSGLNGRLQRIAQRLTSVIALLPASLGQKAMSASLAVAIASDQSAVPVNPAVAATGGASKVKYAAQTTTVQTVKGTAGKLNGYFVYNPNASVAYVQLFDVATATTVTLGTTAPDVVIGIPASSAANLLDAGGVDFANGIKLACTTTATGSTAPGTGLDLSVFYK